MKKKNTHPKLLPLKTNEKSREQKCGKRRNGISRYQITNYYLKINVIVKTRQILAIFENKIQKIISYFIIDCFKANKKFWCIQRRHYS